MREISGGLKDSLVREELEIELCLKTIQIKQDTHEPKLWQWDLTWKSEFQSCFGDMFGRTLHLVVASQGKEGGKETCFGLETEDTIIQEK